VIEDDASIGEGAVLLPRVESEGDLSPERGAVVTKTYQTTLLSYGSAS
jgi:acetyltransferase-like isoleucine patch superfamily enzyme